MPWRWTRTSLSPEAAVSLLTSRIGGATAIELRRLRQSLRREELLGGGGRTSDALLVEALLEPGALATPRHRGALRAPDCPDDPRRPGRRPGSRRQRRNGAVGALELHRPRRTLDRGRAGRGSGRGPGGPGPRRHDGPVPHRRALRGPAARLRTGTVPRVPAQPGTPDGHPGGTGPAGGRRGTHDAGQRRRPGMARGHRARPAGRRVAQHPAPRRTARQHAVRRRRRARRGLRPAAGSAQPAARNPLRRTAQLLHRGLTGTAGADLHRRVLGGRTALLVPGLRGAAGPGPGPARLHPGGASAHPARPRRRTAPVRPARRRNPRGAWKPAPCSAPWPPPSRPCPARTPRAGGALRRCPPRSPSSRRAAPSTSRRRRWRPCRSRRWTGLSRPPAERPPPTSPAAWAPWSTPSRRTCRMPPEANTWPSWSAAGRRSG